jgi:hypothetical protein
MSEDKEETPAAGSDPYLTELYKASTYNVQQFDKNMLYIASGALTLSMGFIEKVLDEKLEVTEHSGLVVISWTLFTLAILISLVTHFMVILVLNKYIAYYGVWTTDEMDNYRVKWNRASSIFKIVSILSLVIGIILHIVYISYNSISNGTT